MFLISSENNYRLTCVHLRSIRLWEKRMDVNRNLDAWTRLVVCDVVKKASYFNMKIIFVYERYSVLEQIYWQNIFEFSLYKCTAIKYAHNNNLKYNNFSVNEHLIETSVKLSANNE